MTQEKPSTLDTVERIAMWVWRAAILGLLIWLVWWAQSITIFSGFMHRIAVS